MPSGDTLKTVSAELEDKLGFSQCAGVKHIPIASQEEFPADYYNCRGWHSILMQIMLAISLMFILGGQEEYMMRGFSSIQACIDEVKVVTLS